MAAIYSDLTSNYLCLFRSSDIVFVTLHRRAFAYNERMWGSLGWNVTNEVIIAV